MRRLVDRALVVAEVVAGGRRQVERPPEERRHLAARHHARSGRSAWSEQPEVIASRVEPQDVGVELREIRIGVRALDRPGQAERLLRRVEPRRPDLDSHGAGRVGHDVHRLVRVVERVRADDLAVGLAHDEIEVAGEHVGLAGVRAARCVAAPRQRDAHRLPLDHRRSCAPRDRPARSSVPSVQPPQMPLSRIRFDQRADADPTPSWSVLRACRRASACAARRRP